MTKPRALTSQAVLRDYFARLRRMGSRAEAHALLTESESLREVFAYGASRGQKSFEQIRNLLDSNFVESEIDPEWLAKLARVCALQEIRQDDALFALKALRISNRHLRKNADNVRFHKLEIELLAEYGYFREATIKVLKNDYLRMLFHRYLEVDLQNPFVQDIVPSHQWLEGFNEPFRQSGLRPVLVESGAAMPFDRLSTLTAEGPAPMGPKVSVVMTSYKPDHEAFLLSAKSILAQSWTNIELVIVDDATPGEFSSVLNEVEQMDPRVRILRLRENGGTYKARNVGMAVASGDFITGQDADDWSHPDRLLTQVRYLQAHADRPGVVTSAIRTDENLLRLRRGANPGRRCEVSLMVRNEIARQVGGYLPARKAADSEFRQRISIYSGCEVGEISDPLYIIRLLPNSLSRGDFRPGWSHPTRRAFWNACTYWHTNSEPKNLKIGSMPRLEELPLPIPGRFQVDRPIARKFDVVFAADFREFTGRQRSVLDEIGLLVKNNLSVGILQFESLRFPANGVLPLCDSLQQLINAGTVSHVMPDEGAEVKSLVLRDPALFQFPPSRPSLLSVDTMLIVAQEGPAGSNGAQIQYRPMDIHSNVEQYFGSTPRWVAAGNETENALIQHGLDRSVLLENPWPTIIRPDQWTVPRDRWRNNTPVLGRHSENQEMQWPSSALDIETIWPEDQGLDVRIMGDARAAMRISHRRTYPNSWSVFRGTEISPRAFYSSIDFFVYYPNENWPEDATREVIEAMASGCVVILPKFKKGIYADAAIYADPLEIPDVIAGLRDDWIGFTTQAESGRSHVAAMAQEDMMFNELERLLFRAPRSGGLKFYDATTVIS